MNKYSGLCMTNIHDIVKIVTRLQTIASDALTRILEKIGNELDDLTKSSLIAGTMFRDCTLVKLGIRRMLTALDKKGITNIDTKDIVILIVTICGITELPDIELGEKVWKLIEKTLKEHS